MQVAMLLWLLAVFLPARGEIDCVTNGNLTVTLATANVSYFLSDCVSPRLHIVLATSNVSIELVNVSIAALSVLGRSRNGSSATLLDNVTVSIDSSELDSCAGVFTLNASSVNANYTRYDTPALQISSTQTSAAPLLNVRITRSTLRSCNASALSVAIGNVSMINTSIEMTTLHVTNSLIESTFHIVPWWQTTRKTTTTTAVVAAVALGLDGHAAFVRVTFVASSLSVFINDSTAALELVASSIFFRPQVQILVLGLVPHGSFISATDMVMSFIARASEALGDFLSPRNVSLRSVASSVTLQGVLDLPPTFNAHGAALTIVWNSSACDGGHVLGAGMSFGGPTASTGAVGNNTSIELLSSTWDNMRDDASTGGIMVCLSGTTCLQNSVVRLESARGVWWRNITAAQSGTVSSLLLVPRAATFVNISITVRCSELIVSYRGLNGWHAANTTPHVAALLAVPRDSSGVNVTLATSYMLISAPILLSNGSAVVSTGNASSVFPTVRFYAAYVDGSVVGLKLRLTTCRIELPLLETSWDIVQSTTVNGSAVTRTIGRGHRSFSQVIYAPINVTITTDEWHSRYFGPTATSSLSEDAVIVAECTFLTLLDRGVVQGSPMRVDSGSLSALGEYLPALWRSFASATAESSLTFSASYAPSQSINNSNGRTHSVSHSEDVSETPSVSLTMSQLSHTSLLVPTKSLLPSGTLDKPTSTNSVTASTSSSNSARHTQAPPTPAPPSVLATTLGAHAMSKQIEARPAAALAFFAAPVGTVVFVQLSVARPRNGLKCSRVRKDGACAGQLTLSTSSSLTPTQSLSPSETLSPTFTSSATPSTTKASPTASKTPTTFGDNVSAIVLGSQLSALELLTQPANVSILLMGTWFPRWGLTRTNCSTIRFVPTSFNFSLGLSDATGLNDKLSPIGITAGRFIESQALLMSAGSLVANLVIPESSDTFRNVVEESVTIWFYMEPHCTARGDKTLFFNLTISRIVPFTFSLDGAEYDYMQDVSLIAVVLSSMVAAAPAFALDVARISSPINILRCQAVDGPLRHYQAFVSWQLVVDANNPDDVRLGNYYGMIALIGIVWVGVFMMHTAFVGLYKVVTATTLLKGSIDGRYPSLLLIPLFALLQPMSMGVTTVVQSGAVGGSLWLGVAGGVLCLAACAAVTLRHVCCFASTCDEGALASRRPFFLARWLLGTSVWNDHPDEDILCFTQRHNVWFRAYRDRFHWVFLIEMWTSVALGILEGVHLGESSCIPLIWAAGVVFVIRMLFHVIARPYDAPFWNLGIVLISASEALLCATVIAFDWIDIADQATRSTIQDVGEWDMRVAVYLIAVFSGIGLVTSIVAYFADHAESEYRDARATAAAGIPQLDMLTHETAEVLRLVDAICDDIAQRSDAYDPALHKAFVSAHLELMLPGCEDDAERSLLDVLREFDVAALESGNKGLFTASMEQLFERLATKYSRQPDEPMLQEAEQTGGLGVVTESSAVLRPAADGSLLASAINESSRGVVDVNDVEMRDLSPKSMYSPTRSFSLPRRGSMVEREQHNRSALSFAQRQGFLDEILQDERSVTTSAGKGVEL